jgi:DNA-binding NarL/FixJ family response regulator
MPRIYKGHAGVLSLRRPRLRVVLADEHTILRRGLRAMLEGESDLEVIGEASGVSDAIALTRCLQPDVVITDVFENGRGILAISEMLRECVDLRIVMLTGCRDQEWERAAMMAGAHAYVVNDSPIEVLLSAIRAESAGFDLLAAPRAAAAPNQHSAEEPAEAPLAEMTAREREVLIGIALGYSSKRIAGDLGRSVKTIEKHRFKMMHKLGLRNTAAVTRYAMDSGLLDTDSKSQEFRPARLLPRD